LGKKRILFLTKTLQMGQTSVPEALVAHQKLTPGYNPKTFDPFYPRPCRWDKQVFPKRWLHTKNLRRATTQKLLILFTQDPAEIGREHD
jgi:hypothetical protein